MHPILRSSSDTSCFAEPAPDRGRDLRSAIETGSRDLIEHGYRAVSACLDQRDAAPFTHLLAYRSGMAASIPRPVQPGHRS